jgi:hypothetical protein
VARASSGRTVFETIRAVRPNNMSMEKQTIRIDSRVIRRIGAVIRFSGTMRPNFQFMSGTSALTGAKSAMVFFPFHRTPHQPSASDAIREANAVNPDVCSRGLSTSESVRVMDASGTVPGNDKIRFSPSTRNARPRPLYRIRSTFFSTVVMRISIPPTPSRRPSGP